MPGDIELARIREEVSSAVMHRIAVNSTGNLMSGEGAHALHRAEKAHHKQLKTLRAAVAKGKPPAVKAAVERLLFDFAPRLMAVVRATGRRRQPLPFAALESWAQNLSVGHIYQETLIIRPKVTEPGRWRPICTSGIRRRAQQLMLRDLLLMQVGDSSFDSTVAGSGGETQLFADMKSAIADGYYFWTGLDVRNFFPSLRPGHLAGLPLPEWMIRNIVFLPPEAPIRFIDIQYGVDLTEQAIMDGGDGDQPVCPLYNWGTIRSKVKQVRQGLIQGDVCAPQIARTVLGRELQHALEPWGVIYGSHLDDIVIGARSQSELEASIKALTQRLNGLPAGPLELHHHKICDVRESAYILGYRISLKKDGSVYVRPGMERFGRFRSRLMERLKKSLAFTKAGLLKEATAYARHWFRAHPAWDKAPPVGASPYSGPSWDYVQSEVAECVNRVIFEEW